MFEAAALGDNRGRRQAGMASTPVLVSCGISLALHVVLLAQLGNPSLSRAPAGDPEVSVKLAQAANAGHSTRPIQHAGLPADPRLPETGAMEPASAGATTADSAGDAGPDPMAIAPEPGSREQESRSRHSRMISRAGVHTTRGDRAAADPPEPVGGKAGTTRDKHAALNMQPPGGGGVARDQRDDTTITPPRYRTQGLSNPLPHYPRVSRRMGQEGLVVLRVRISEQGRVESVAVHRSSGYSLLNEAAVKAVRKWNFHPATRDGVSVAGTLEVPVSFRLTD